jgi:hypothetical protein
MDLLGLDLGPQLLFFSHSIIIIDDLKKPCLGDILNHSSNRKTEDVLAYDTCYILILCFFHQKRISLP